MLERIAPWAAGRLATRLWFTLPPHDPRPWPRPDTPGERFAVEVHGGAVKGTAYGPVGAPVAYLVHGWGGQAAHWHAFVDPLVAAGFRVVTWDGPSHGASDPGPMGRGRTTPAEQAAALRAVAEHHGPPAALLAHSLGALFSFLAIRDGVAPERIALVATVRDPEPFTRLFTTALGGGERTWRGLVAGIERTLGRPLSDADLRTITPTGPVLLVHDRRDRETSPQFSADLAAAWPGSQVLHTEGLGHRRILRDPAVVEAVVTHLAQRQPAATVGGATRTPRSRPGAAG